MITEEQFLKVADTVKKYGWYFLSNSDGGQLYNSKEKLIVTVYVRGNKYTFFDMSGSKLMTGKGQLETSIEKLLTQYYYCQPINNIQSINS